MRHITGAAVVPSGLPVLSARWILVELRDETLLDQASVLLAESRQDDVVCRPGARLPFGFEAPEADPARMLGLRVHVDMTGRGAVAPGDLLSTRAVPVPPTGHAVLTVPLTLVRG